MAPRKPPKHRMIHCCTNLHLVEYGPVDSPNYFDTMANVLLKEVSPCMSVLNFRSVWCRYLRLVTLSYACKFSWPEHPHGRIRADLVFVTQLLSSIPS